MTALLIADAEYAVREWARGLTDLTALVGRRVDLHEPRSPTGPHVEVRRISGAPGSTSDMVTDEPLIQFDCKGPTKKAAAQVRDVLLTAIVNLNRAGPAVMVDNTQGRAVCRGSLLQSTSELPDSDRETAGFQITATFYLSPT